MVAAMLRIIIRVSVLITVFLLICIEGINPAPLSGSEHKTYRILYINSYHRGYKWSDGIEQGLLETLNKSGLKIEISVEYLDSRRFAEELKTNLMHVSWK